MLIGKLALIIFFLTLIATVKGWIPQRYITIQTSLLLSGVLIIVLGLLFGISPNLDSIASLTNLHPITATIAGFIAAGALKAAGGFDAAGDLLKKATKSRLGLPFSTILLVNLPSILAMPCGRIIVSALIPVALLLGYTVIQKEDDHLIPSMIMFGLTINAAASCGPSLIGGIGTLGEGMGRYAPGSFSDAQQMGIVVATVITMAMIKYFFKLDVDLKHFKFIDSDKEVHSTGYLSLGIFLFGLATIVLIKPKIPLQVMLMVITVFIMLIAKLKIKNLLNEILIHPLTAMIAGFIIAGILNEYGAFNELIKILNIVAEYTPIGYVGVAIIIIYLPIIFPLPCGRIIAVSLIPAVLILGAKLSVISGNSHTQAVITIGFILSGAASCGPSPLGGIGCIGEGNLRLKEFASGKPQVFGIFLGVPVACLLMSQLDAYSGEQISILTMLSITICSGIAMNFLLNKKIYHLGGIIGGLTIGLLMIIF